MRVLLTQRARAAKDYLRYLREASRLAIITIEIRATIVYREKEGCDISTKGRANEKGSAGPTLLEIIRYNIASRRLRML